MRVERRRGDRPLRQRSTRQDHLFEHLDSKTSYPRMVDSSTSALVPWLGVPAQHLLPMGILLAYFATIAVLFRFVFLAAAGRKPEQVGRVAANGRDTGRWAQGFLTVARAAFAHTWYRSCSLLSHLRPCSRFEG